MIQLHMNVKVVYKSLKDKEFLDIVNLKAPIFIEFIDINTRKGKKEGWKLMNYYGTQLFPFVELEIDEFNRIPFYSEKGNAIGQFINYFNIMLKVKVINKGNKSLPKFETTGSAGADVRADFSRINEFPIKVYGGAEVIPAGEAHDKVMIKLTPHSRALIPTGLFMAVPEGYEMQVRPRSGLALKEGLTVINTPGTVDSDYRNEVGVVIINTSNEDRFIEDGERIAQLLIKEAPQFEWMEVDELDTTDRKGGWGHTGKV